MRKLAIIALLEVLLFAILFISVLVYPGEDSTVWSLGYSEQAYHAVRIGWTKAHVMATVGRPLNAYYLGHPRSFEEMDRQSSSSWYRDHWSYTAPGRAGSCAFYVRQLTFGPGGRVVSKEAYYEGD